jgi:RHS repeat-associated protein
VSSGNTDYFPTYDGNGNVSEYLTTAGVVSVHYEYDPFGTLTRRTGSPSNRFQYRFSTKPRDFNTGLHYYLYRWYDPLTGRWPSRDPIEGNLDTGEINEYAYVANEAIGFVDVLGLEIFSDTRERKREYRNLGEDKKVVSDWQTIKPNYTGKLDKCVLTVEVPVRFSISRARGTSAEGKQRLSDGLKDGSLFNKLKKEVEDKWSGKMRLCCTTCKPCPDGIIVNVELKKVDRGGMQVELYDEPGVRLGDQTNWNTAIPGTAAHEVGHHLGNFDEYLGALKERDRWHDYREEDPDSLMVTEKGSVRDRHFEDIARRLGMNCKVKKESEKCD